MGKKYNSGMTLTLQEVEHIAALAKLALSTEEKARYREQLSAILDYAAKLQQVDTSSVPPTLGVFNTQSRLRPDTPRPGLRPEQTLQNTAHTQDGQFKIPPVFGETE